ncbi:MAG: c-type cytochrome [bacterium]|nr:c-type cytochrome [bacterium]
MRLLSADGWLVLLCALALVGASPSDSGAALPDDPLEGRLLFENRNCVQCHGIAGNTPGVGPDLGHEAFGGSLLDLGAALWNHVPGMSVSFEDAKLPWPELSQTEVVELTSFLYFIEYLGQPGDATAGRATFRVQGCQECHELSGFGGRGGLGPDLDGLESFASPLFVAQAIWNHGPEMFETIRTAGMAVPSFGEGDLADLSAYFRQATAEGPAERTLLAPGNPNHGRELFRSRGCALCHGRNATGGGDGPDLTRADLHRSAETIAGLMWNHASVMSEMMLSRGVGWPSFSTAELADLIAYLYFLPFADRPGDPVRGEDAFSARSCAECHGGGAASAHQGSDLAGTAASRSPAAFIAALWSHAPVMKEAILGEGKLWPELSGEDLRNLLAYLQRTREAESEQRSP